MPLNRCNAAKVQLSLCTTGCTKLDRGSIADMECFPTCVLGRCLCRGELGTDRSDAQELEHVYKISIYVDEALSRIVRNSDVLDENRQVCYCWIPHLVLQWGTRSALEEECVCVSLKTDSPHPYLCVTEEHPFLFP